MAGGSAKTRRSEELFTPAQRQRMLWLYENGYGIEAVMERYGLTHDAAEEYVKSEQAAKRKARAVLTDWSARYSEFRAATPPYPAR